MKLDDIPEGWKKALMVPLVSMMFERTNVETQDAWQQAIGYVRGFAPQTELEFRLVVRMAILNIEANHASMLSTHPQTTVSQSIRLQANAVALAKAADDAESRLKQLQAARAQRAEAAPKAPPAQPQASTPTSPQTTKDEAKAISEFARKNGMTYAQAWNMYQQEKKAIEAEDAAARAR
jgi:nucleoid-associated protein YgaU